jgi:Arc/MetJ family transcription regulator
MHSGSCSRSPLLLCGVLRHALVRELAVLRPHTEVCRIAHMATNLAIDDELLTEAQKVGGHRTKKDTVNEALKEYIQRRRQAKITGLFGTIQFDAAYDHKKQRRRS